VLEQLGLVCWCIQSGNECQARGECGEWVHNYTLVHCEQTVRERVSCQARGECGKWVHNSILVALRANGQGTSGQAKEEDAASVYG
jgi:hypothetical protein